MTFAVALNVLSMIAGALSAYFRVRAALAKAPPPPGYEGVQNVESWKAVIVDGGELYGTLRLQNRWNSLAAFAAAAAISLQIIYNLMQ